MCRVLLLGMVARDSCMSECRHAAALWLMAAALWLIAAAFCLPPYPAPALGLQCSNRMPAAWTLVSSLDTCQQCSTCPVCRCWASCGG